MKLCFMIFLFPVALLGGFRFAYTSIINRKMNPYQAPTKDKCSLFRMSFQQIHLLYVLLR